jgi:putative colanic acid biosynthesis acetyltransferase WcaF
MTQSPHGPETQAADRHRSVWTMRQRIGRLLWLAVQATLFRFSPHNCYRWRAALLRLFGARLGREVKIRPSVRVEVPWNLEVGEHTAIGDFAVIYCLGPVRIGRYVTISQYAHLCAGTHDHTRSDMPLVRPPIRVGDDVWIAADAFVGPGVTIGDRTVLGARASAFKDLPPDVIAVGNPAHPIKPRQLADRPASPATETDGR